MRRHIRTLGRLLILLITISLLATAILWSGRWFSTQLAAAKEELSGGPGISLASPEMFYISLMLSLRNEELTQPAGDDDTPIHYTIEPGETAASIAADLEEQGIVRDAGLLRMYIRYHGWDAHIEAGEHVFRKTMTIEEVAEELLHARTEEIEVTWPPGWRIEQIAEMLEREAEIDKDAFLNLARSGVFDYDFLAGRPEGASLEGFLFPDTYRIPSPATPADVIVRALETFDQRVTPQMRADAAARGLTLYQVVTLASIVEREAVIDAERPIIASVYLNRLDVAHYPETQGYLQADPTFQYARGYDPESGKWWAPFQLEEIPTLDSPYNTFLYPGLPPGPICNPSLASIKAVIYPADTDYLYFFSRGDGSHVFAKTYEEHQRNQALYGGGQ